MNTHPTSIHPSWVEIVVPIYYCDPSLFLPISNCIAALREHYPLMGRICLDDGSPLECPEEWECWDPREENEGFTKTVNEGLISAFRENRAKVAIVLNDDITVLPGQLDRFMELDPERPIIASPGDTASSDDDRFGACWGMTRSAFDLLGLLNEDYRHFYSDLDYYERAKRAGVEIVKWHDIVLDHPESSTYKLVDKESLLAADREAYSRANQ